MLLINLANHGRADDGNGEVSSEEVGAGVLEVGRAPGGDEDEDELESGGNHLHE